MLLDVAGALGVPRLPDGHAVSAAELEAAADGHASRGAATWCSSASGRARCGRTAPAYQAAGGMTADASRWLAAREPLAVGADNVAWDVPDEHDPELGSLPGHTILIVQRGHPHHRVAVPGGARGATACASSAFVCLPLKLRGGTGSPVRPLALA